MEDKVEFGGLCEDGNEPSDFLKAESFLTGLVVIIFSRKTMQHVNIFKFYQILSKHLPVNAINSMQSFLKKYNKFKNCYYGETKRRGVSYLCLIIRTKL